MRKKMYKLKKHWVIAGTAIMAIMGAGSGAVAADETQTILNQQETVDLGENQSEINIISPISENTTIEDGSSNVQIDSVKEQVSDDSQGLASDEHRLDGLNDESDIESLEQNEDENIVLSDNYQAKLNQDETVNQSLDLVVETDLQGDDQDSLSQNGEEAVASTGKENNTKTVEMHRLYNPNSGEHFYTANVAEKDYLVKVGWSYENIGWYAPSTGESVYRLYNPNAGDHHYTLNVGEKNYLVSVGWNYEGIAWHSAGTVAMHRLYNPNAKTGTHHYTYSTGERDFLVKQGWRYEGISWYGVEKQNEESLSTTTSYQGWKYSANDQIWNYYDQSGTLIKSQKTISAANVATPSNTFLATIYKGAIGSLQYGILPSIVAAQAVLESGWGKSTLSLAPNNNLFGIKVSTDWTGDSVTLNTKEYIDGKEVTVGAAFRKYNSWSDSVLDHAQFFSSTEWRKKNYANVLGELNYKRASQALQDAGYATDPNYATKLISIIEYNNLSAWDKILTI